VVAFAFALAEVRALAVQVAGKRGMRFAGRGQARRAWRRRIRPRPASPRPSSAREAGSGTSAACGNTSVYLAAMVCVA